MQTLLEKFMINSNLSFNEKLPHFQKCGSSFFIDFHNDEIFIIYFEKYNKY